MEVIIFYVAYFLICALISLLAIPVLFCASMAAVGIFYVACKLILVIMDAIERAKERRRCL